MTMIERNRFSDRSASFAWLGRAYAALAKAIATRLRERRHRKALIELRSMEDWQLKDVGITRISVEQALRACK